MFSRYALPCKLCILAVAYAFPTVTDAEVLHWWRFEEDQFLQDSVAGVGLTQGDYRQVSLPRASDGAGTSFPSGFKGLGSNRYAFEMHSQRGATAQNTTPVDGNFTVEMFVHFDSLPSTTFTHFLGGQGTPPATPPTWGWGPQVRMDSTIGTRPREFVTLVSEGPFYEYPSSGIILEENIDYYLASTFDLAGKVMTYYAKDLTNNIDLQVVTASHSLERLNPDAHIVVGGSNRSCCVPNGIIDEFRFSNHVLTEEELLINNIAELGADFDFDGDIDGNDFLAWQRGESPNPLSTSDLAEWEANFGMGATLAASSTSVPEPTTYTLALAALCLVMSRRRIAAR